MEDLIYKFLIQAGFPRASIVMDITTVDRSSAPSDASFVIIDPETIERLGVIKVVGPVGADELMDQSALLSVVAERIGGKQLQGFVIRVDAQAQRDDEQVQFYRCFPNIDLHQLNARTFPDFDSMKVNVKLMKPKPSYAPEAVVLPDEELVELPKMPIGAVLPGVIILLLALVDWGMRTYLGTALFDVTHAILLAGGALLLSMPALVKYAGAVLNR